jgi:CO/xanthine dehydrogenase FAD-binding subunit
MASDIKREVLLEEFFRLPEIDIHRENDLKPGEILTAIVLLPMAATVRSVHLKQGERIPSIGRLQTLLSRST